MAQLKFVRAYREVTDRCGASASLVYGYLTMRDGRRVPHRDLTAITGLSGPTIDRALQRLERADPPFIQIERMAGKASIYHDLRYLGLPHNDGGGAVSARCDDPPQSEVPPASDCGTGRITMRQVNEEIHREYSNTNGAPSPTTASDILDVYPRRCAPIAGLREIGSAIQRIAGGTDPGNGLPPGVRGNQEAASTWLWECTKQYADSRAGKPTHYTPYPGNWFADGCYLQMPERTPEDDLRQHSAHEAIDRYTKSIADLETILNERASAGQPTEEVELMIEQQRGFLATWQERE